VDHLEVDASLADRAAVVRRARVAVPAEAIARLVAAAPVPPALRLSVALGDGRLTVSLRAGPIPLRVAFRPVADAGRLVLEPVGGVPGPLLGRLADLAPRRPGLTIGGDGRVTVDPTPFLPTGLSLASGVTAVQVDPSRMVVWLG
jgi:hypothetical protein